MPAGGACVRLPETIKHEGQEFRAYADAGVFNQNLEVRVDALEHDLNASARRREFDRIGQQIPKDLLKAVRVATYEPNAGIEELLDADILARGRGTHGFYGVLDHLMQMERPHLKMDL